MVLEVVELVIAYFDWCLKKPEDVMDLKNTQKLVENGGGHFQN